MAATQQFQPGSDTEVDEEYRAIEATLLQSARGRWFLAEHGRRARRLDSALLEDAIGRLQNSIRQPPALLGQLRTEVETIRAKIDQTRSNLLQRPGSQSGESAEAGKAADDEAAPDSKPDGKEAGDWQPLDKMLAAAEEIHEQAWALQAKDINPEACEAIARQASSLYALSVHQATHSTKILSLADALDATSVKIEGILQTIVHELQVDGGGDGSEAEGDEAVANADEAPAEADGSAPDDAKSNSKDDDDSAK